MNRKADLLLRVLLPVVFGLSVLLGWQGLTSLFEIPAYVFPSPWDVLRAFHEERSTLLRATCTTFVGASYGFAAAVFFGFLISLLLSVSRTVRYGIYPFVILMQMIPIIATSAIIVTVLDVGLQSVVWIAFLIGFFPVVASTLQGLNNVPKEQEELFSLYQANRWQTLWHLRIPNALPQFFVGAKIAATLAVIGTVTGEIFAGSSDGSGGLGFAIIVFKSQLEIAAIFAATIICSLMGFLFVGMVNIAKWAALHRWMPQRRAQADPHDSAAARAPLR